VSTKPIEFRVSVAGSPPISVLKLKLPDYEEYLKTKEIPASLYKKLIKWTTTLVLSMEKTSEFGRGLDYDVRIYVDGKYLRRMSASKVQADHDALKAIQKNISSFYNENRIKQYHALISSTNTPSEIINPLLHT